MKKEIIELNQTKFAEWKTGKITEVIDQKDILLTERIHINSKYIRIKNLLTAFEDKEYIDKVVIVRQFLSGEYEGKYSLVTGLKWLTVARALNKPIRCIVIDGKYDHQRFVREIGIVDKSNDTSKIPAGTDELYPIGKVSIAKFLKKHCPNGPKYQKQEKYFLENGVIDKPITVIKNSFAEGNVIVVDKYTRLLVLIKHNIRLVPVRFVVSN